jgi:predicted transcriptional regulator
MSNTIERLSAIMSRRKNPASAESIAKMLGLAPKTVRNYLSSGPLMDKWLGEKQRVVSILDTKTNQRKYALISAGASLKEGDSLRVGKRNFLVTNADDYRIDVVKAAT